MTSTIDLFTEAMRSNGLEPDEPLIADSVFRRIHDKQDKAGKKDLYYILHGDGVPAGFFGHFPRLLDGQNWQAKADNGMTPQERQQNRERIEQSQAERERVMQEVRAACVVKAEKMWAAAVEPNPEHAYIVGHGITPYGAKQLKDMLLIPIRRGSVLTGLQIIMPDGSKKFLTGTDKSGGYCVLKGTTSVVYLVEGWATGCTVHEQTSATVLVSFDCGNLLKVAKDARAKATESDFVICADNDRLTAGNPGLAKATAAALAIGARLAVPVFPGDEGTDFNDLARLAGPEAVKICIEAASKVEPAASDTPAPDDFQEIPEPSKKASLPQIKTMTDLLNTTFAAIRWVIFGLLPEGLAILSGPPKIGKSWMVMNLCLAVALGGYVFGKFKVDMGEVLLLSLEDNERRLKGRLLKCLGDVVAFLSNFHAITSWKRLDQGGLEDLAEWLEIHPDCKLVVIDTMQKIKAHPKRKNGNAYENDYDSYGDLQRLALLHRCCILVIHHNRKSDSKNDGDPLEAISGSTGVTGSMDTILMLRRPRGSTGAVLTATGRDISEAEYAMNFDGTLGQWIVTGQAAEISMKADSQASTILAFMKNNAGSMLSVRDIYEGLGEKIKFDTVKRELGRMAEKGILQRDKGKFAYFAPISTVSLASLVPDISTHKDTRDTKDALAPKDTKDMNMYGFVDTAGIKTLNEFDFEGMI